LNIVETGNRFIGASAWRFFIVTVCGFVIKGEEVAAAEMSRDDDPIVILAEFDSESTRLFISP
jgi:hypothetical protein